MDNLQELITKLSREEIISIERYYKGRKSSEANIRLKLFNLLKQGHQSEDAYNKLQIEYKACHSRSAFSHLTNRIKEDIISLLTISGNPKKYPNSLSEAKLYCRHFLSQSEILFAKGNYTIAIQRLKLAQHMAQDFELFIEELRIYDLVNTYVTFPDAINKFIDKNKGNINYVNEFTEVFRQIFNVKKCRTDFRENFIFFKDTNRLNKKLINKSYKDLKITFRKTGSVSIKYWYYQASVYHYYLKADYKNALINATNILRLINNNPIIYSPIRNAEAKLQIATLMLYYNKYEKAVDYAEQILKSNDADILSELYAMEILFVVNFYRQNYKQAELLYNQFINDTRYSFSDFITQKWEYFNANLQFINGSYTESFTKLLELNLLSDDKSGWALGIKLLELLNLYEQKEDILFEEKLKAFMQYLRRRDGKSILRYKCICKILNSFWKDNYDKIQQVHSKEFQLLDKHKDYKWAPFGSEIIQFEKWFTQKANPLVQKNFNYQQDVLVTTPTN